jgi:hypothetical protein
VFIHQTGGGASTIFYTSMAGQRLTKSSLSLESTMFHEVKIFDKKGMVKKVLSSKKLSSEYWNSFFNNPLSDAKKKGKGAVTNRKTTQVAMMKISSDMADCNSKP